MFQAVKGMQDRLPETTLYWTALEEYLKDLVNQYAYREIRFPIVEKAALFKHSIGDTTDIVEKEMYVFKDSKDQLLSLRPEGTASCARAAIESRLLYNESIQRFWYLGPMFRRERPQKGRYRQFHQFGIEAFGMSSPEIEMEMILMTNRLWKNLGIRNQVTLQLNSLGNQKTRDNYRTALISYLKKNYEKLDDDSKRRFLTNPLRILDSKNPTMQFLIQEAPIVTDYLDESSLVHFTQLQVLLKAVSIPFTINPFLVRGLDYYNDTVFEWIISDEKSAQNTICGGGRYDELTQRLKGPKIPATGFAIGIERLITLWQSQKQHLVLQVPHLYIIKKGERAVMKSIIVAETLRNVFPKLQLQMDCTNSRFNYQFKKANMSGAAFALVIGENEIETNVMSLKNLKTHEQNQMTLETLTNYLKEMYKKL